jgi:AcrR family transcriptional regulator
LQHALITLILEKGYDAVTVEDICAAANVGRSTFYLHYASKDDLKRRGLEHLREQLIHRQKQALAADKGAESPPLAFSLAMFEHASEHIELYRALDDSDGGAISIGGIRKMLCQLARDELAVSGFSGAEESIPRELAVQYLVGGYMSVLTWWLDGGTELSAEEVDAMFRRLATQGLAALKS